MLTRRQIYLDMPKNWTVHEKGAKYIKLISTGYDKSWVTIVWCITADGNKLPSYNLVSISY